MRGEHNGDSDSGGRIVDAATDTDKTGDIYLEDGIITEIGQKLKKKTATQ